MKHIFILSAAVAAMIIILYPQNIYAQNTAPDIQWEKALGGSGTDYANSVQVTIDGGYIVAGYSSSNDGNVTGHHGNTGPFDDDFWVVKLDSVGSIQWENSYGGSGDDRAYSIRQVRDGGYIVVGSTASNDGDVSGNHGGGGDYWVVKLDDLGNIQWEKCYGGSGQDIAFDVKQTNDGGYIVTGGGTSDDVTGFQGREDYLVVKTDSLGNLQWQKCYGGTDYDEAHSIQQTGDSGYIIAGYSSSSNGDVTGQHGTSGWPQTEDCWVVKIDSSGTIQWEKCYGGSYRDEANDIEQTRDGGYIIAGDAQSINGDVSGHHGDTTVPDYWVVKISALGDIQWENSFGGSWEDDAYSIHQLNNGGYIIAGWGGLSNGDETGSHGDYDVWIVQLDSFGKIQWENSYGGESNDVASCIQVIPNGGFIVAGATSSISGEVTGYHGGGYYDYWVAKLGYSTPNISSRQKQILHPLLCDLEIYDTLWVHNIGKGILNITSAMFDTLGQDFSILSPSVFPLNINPGDSVEFTVRFAPSITGTLATTLDLYSNDTANGHNPWQINFTGQKDSVSFFVSGIVNDTLDFGDLPMNTPKDSGFILGSYATIGYPLPFFALSINDSLFTVSQYQLVDSGMKLLIPVHFTGSDTGQYIATLVITDTCGRTDTTYLKATIRNTSSPAIQITDPIDAGYVHINTQKTVPFTIKNTGTSTITIDSMTLLGTDAQYYRLKNVPQLPFTIAAGNTQTMNITFSPINAGVHDATLDIVTSLSPTAIDIAVTGIGTRSILQAEALHFDTVAVATCKTEAMKITNAGSYPLLITNVGLRGIYAGDYTIVSVPTDTLQAGDTADIMIKYCPTALGEEDAIAQIVTSDGDTLDVNIYGAGSGPNAVYELLPTNTSLSQNYPNPFTATTTIHVELSPTDARSAQLNVYNVLGEEVADLSQELRQSNDVTFTANNLQAGVYYYTLETATRQLTRQMFIIN